MWLEASPLAGVPTVLSSRIPPPSPDPGNPSSRAGENRGAGISISLPSPRHGKVLHSKVPPLPWPREPIEWGGRKHAGENVHAARGWS